MPVFENQEQNAENPIPQAEEEIEEKTKIKQN